MFQKIFSKPIFRISVVILINENIFKTSPVLCKEIKHRHFSRFTSRKPLKVLSQEKLESGGFDTEEFFKSEYTDSFETNPLTQTSKKEKENILGGNRLIQDRDTSAQLDYTILEENDVSFSKLMTLVGNRKLRRKNNLMMLEGKRLNADAIQAGLKPLKIFFSQKSLLEDLKMPPNINIPLYKIPYKTIALWSKLDCPPGVIGFYNLVQEGDIKTRDTIPVKVVCDNVRDPGNMGSIIRVAASVGCTEIIMLKGCTDPWDSKVLRSASGGHFHIPMTIDMIWSQHREFLHPGDTICLADSKKDRIEPLATNLPQHLYYEMDYKTPRSVVILIGGETEGLSVDAFKVAAKYNGSRLHIPLSNSMESLNSGCALSVILFEIKRQYLTDGLISNSGPLKEEKESTENEGQSLRAGLKS